MTAAFFPEVVVNGVVIPSGDIAAEAQNHPAPAGKPGLAWRQAARALIVRQLLLDEAMRRGLLAEPQSMGEGRVETEDEALIRAVMEAEITVAVPEEADVRAEWARAPERFRSPPLWEVSHILCGCGAGDDAAAARAKADFVLAAVLADPRRFAELAMRESDCGSKGSGGALGQLSPGDTMPEFEVALWGMVEGEVLAEPLRTRHGWHIIRMDAYGEGQVLPYEALRDGLAEAMEKRSWTHAAHDFVSGLIAAAKIEGLTVEALQTA